MTVPITRGRPRLTSPEYIVDGDDSEYSVDDNDYPGGCYHLNDYPGGFYRLCDERTNVQIGATVMTISAIAVYILFPSPFAAVVCAPITVAGVIIGANV